MSKQQREAEARLRAELIVQVRSGVVTAAEAARRLGVSRKTYYKWERRGLEGMVGALGRRAGGRPPGPADEEKARLEDEVGQLRRKLLLAEQRLAIQEMMHREDGAVGAKKKGRASGHDR